MKRWFMLLCLIGSVHAAPINLDLVQISLPDLSRLVFGEILNRSYVFDADILEHSPLVTLSLKNVTADQVEKEVQSLLILHGFACETEKGLTRIVKLRDKPQDDQVYVYRPRFRSSQYLLDLVSGLFPVGAFTTQQNKSSMPFNQVQGGQHFGPNMSGIQPGGMPLINQGMNSITKPDSDVLVFKGSQAQITKLEGILAQLDQSAGELLVKAVVYEVQNNRKEGSAVDLALSIIAGKVGVNLISAATIDNQKVSFSFINSGVDLSAIYSSISSDDRFKQITSPRLRIRSGGSAKFSVGNQTPVLGSVSYDNQGHPIQSVEYKPSGVIFELKPVIRDKIVLLDVKQQISQFVPTTTGVNTTPTLNTRELSTQVSAAAGEIILIGGLDEDRQSDSNRGLSFLPAFLRSQQDDITKTEIVLMLQLDQI